MNQYGLTFNQGLDARLITPKVAQLLSGLHWMRFVRLSCDTEQMIPVIRQAVAYMREAGIAPSRFWAYMLVQDVNEAHRRARALDAMGVIPFAQPYRDYDGSEPTREQRRFARWVNVRSAFKSCRWEGLHWMKSARTGSTFCGESNPKEWEYWMLHRCKDENGTEIRLGARAGLHRCGMAARDAGGGVDCCDTVFTAN